MPATKVAAEDADFRAGRRRLVFQEVGLRPIDRIRFRRAAGAADPKDRSLPLHDRSQHLGRQLPQRPYEADHATLRRHFRRPRQPVADDLRQKLPGVLLPLRSPGNYGALRLVEALAEHQEWLPVVDWAGNVGDFRRRRGCACGKQDRNEDAHSRPHDLLLPDMAQITWLLVAFHGLRGSQLGHAPRATPLPLLSEIMPAKGTSVRVPCSHGMN